MPAGIDDVLLLGSRRHDGIGACVAGLATCARDGSGYGPCAGEVTPVPETCATSVDDDCDGAVNERGIDCECVPSTQSVCYSGPSGTQGVGICQPGVQTCNDEGTGYGPCVGETTPQVETCLAPEDEDCDGMVNEEGAGCVCVPADTAPCYTGPPGTQGVGPCAAGTQTCNGLGTGFGPCMGEVLPAPEDCMTAIDEDCDGSTPPCEPPGKHLWSKDFGNDANWQEGLAIDTDASGNVYLGGRFSGSMSFGGPTLTALLVDAYLAKLDASGNHVWSKSFGDASDQAVTDVAIGPSGEVVVVGYLEGTADLGGGPLTSAGQYDVLVARFDAAGNHVWSKRFGDSTHQYGQRVAVDPSGNVVIAGSFYGALTFGVTVLVSAGNIDAFVAKLDANGNPVWAKRFGGIDGDAAEGLALDAMGRPRVVGRFNGVADLGAGLVASAGGSDAFVTGLDAAGAVQFVSAFGDAADQIGWSAATDAAGNVIVAGSFAGTLDLGGGPLVASGSSNLFVGKLSPSGAHIASKRFGEAMSFTSGVDVDVDGAGNVLLTADFFEGTIDFGGGPVGWGGGYDVVVAKLGPMLAHVYGKRFGDSSTQTRGQIAADPSGNALVIGSFAGSVDFGGGALTGGNIDVFVAKLGP